MGGMPGPPCMSLADVAVAHAKPVSSKLLLSLRAYAPGFILTALPA